MRYLVPTHLAQRYVIWTAVALTLLEMQECHGWFKETPTSQWQAKLRHAWNPVQRPIVNREDIWKCCAYPLFALVESPQVLPWGACAFLSFPAYALELLGTGWLGHHP